MKSGKTMVKQNSEKPDFRKISDSLYSEPQKPVLTLDEMMARCGAMKTGNDTFYGLADVSVKFSDGEAQVTIQFDDENPAKRGGLSFSIPEGLIGFDVPRLTGKQANSTLTGRRGNKL